MGRVMFANNNQVEFLKYIKLYYGLSNDQLALICNVSPRTFRDWLRGKFSISERGLLDLTNKLSISLPKNIKVIDDFWYTAKGARKGALRRIELYGPPGTKEGRYKGGINSQLRRRENPEKYRLLGCNIRKEFKIDMPTIRFAEATGIILGDGCISDHQVRVSLSTLVDQPYSLFVIDLFKKVFKSTPTVIKRSDCNAMDLTISGVGFVQELERWGFIRGDKVRQQVGFPKWIWTNKEFQIACIRGLMDTDGGCYFHKHKTGGLTYRNFGMCFSNKSLPLITSMAKVLTNLEIKFSLSKASTKLYIYSLEEIKKYFSLIGSNNPKNVEKFNEYSSETTHRVVV